MFKIVVAVGLACAAFAMFTAGRYKAIGVENHGLALTPDLRATSHAAMDDPTIELKTLRHVGSWVCDAAACGSVARLTVFAIRSVNGRLIINTNEAKRIYKALQTEAQGEGAVRYWGSAQHLTFTNQAGALRRLYFMEVTSVNNSVATNLMWKVVPDALRQAKAEAARERLRRYADPANGNVTYSR